MTVERIWVWIGWTLLIGSLAGWPISALTVARHEPQVVLAISWIALGFSAAGVLVTAQAQRKLVARLEQLIKDQRR